MCLKKRMYHTLAFCLLFALNAAILAQSSLESVDVRPQKNETVLVMQLNKSCRAKHFMLDNPKRFVLDLLDTNVAKQFQLPPFKSKQVKGLRLGKYQDKTRFVLDLSDYKRYELDKKRHAGGYQIKLHLVGRKHTATENKVTQAKPTTVYKPKSRAPSVFTVIIDAGHGGKDPGAIGARNTYEKTVVLKISRLLKRKVDAIPGMRGILTRSKDHYVALRERLDVARRYKGDIFISIHADAFKDRKYHGASVFALSERGATSEGARWLAEKENYSELGGINLSNKGDILRSVLIDLSQTATISSSLVLGRAILREFGKFTNIHGKRVEQAPFVVLKSPDIPSVLVECGFISNLKEEQRLRTSAYQEKVAQGIMRGLSRYYRENYRARLDYQDPQRSASIQPSYKRYRVKNGDSLVRIAKKHQTSLSYLKKLNKLRTNHIIVGQTLKVPVS